MKQSLLLIAFALCIISGVQSQSNGSFFALQLAKKTCLFKYNAQGDTLKSLILMDSSDRSVNIKYGPHDTVTTIHPVTHQKETKIISSPSLNYHIETTMTYSDFLILLKSKFELKNPQKNLRVYSFNIYYETSTEGGMIRVIYPDKAQGVVSKLNVLTKSGGFILLSLKAADHDQINIDAGGTFLALIHIKN